jgi:hypothetical protein
LGRGIRVEFGSREQFIRWALEMWPGETFKGKDFDRVDNDGHYSPNNLRLVTRAENLRNRRTTVRVDVGGVQMCVTDLWGFLRARNPNFSLSARTTARLAAEGVSVDEILSRKPRRKRSTTL